MKFSRRHKGSISIFLIIVMCPMLIFGMSIVDIAKIFFAQNTVSTAGELAINSGLSTYDKVLKDVYGLIATSATEEELTEKMNMYYLATLNSTGITSKDNSKVSGFFNGLFGNSDNQVDNNNLLRVSVPEVEGAQGLKTAKILESSIANPAVLKRQIIEYMKYRGPVSIGTGILEKLTCFGDLSNQTNATTAKINFEENLEQIEKKSNELYDMLNNYIVPLEKMNEFTSLKAKCLIPAFWVGFGYMNFDEDNFTEYYFNNFASSKKKLSGSAENDLKKIKDDKKAKKSEKAESILVLAIVGYGDDADKVIKRWNGLLTEYYNKKSVMSKSYDKLTEKEATELAEASYNLLADVYNTMTDPENNAYGQELINYWYLLKQAYNISKEDSVKDEMDEITSKLDEVKTVYSEMHTYLMNLLDGCLNYYNTCYTSIKDAISKNSAIKSKIEGIKESIGKAKENSAAWAENNETINTSSVQSNMKSQHKEETAALEDVDEEAIEYMENLIVSQKTMLENAKKAFEQITYCDTALYKNLTNKDAVYRAISSKIDNYSAQNAQAANYASSQLRTDVYFSDTSVTGLFDASEKIKATELYKFLEEKCQSSNIKANEKQKSDAQEAENSIKGVDQSYDTPPAPTVSNTIIKNTKTFDQQYSAATGKKEEDNQTFGQISSINSNNQNGAKTALGEVGTMFEGLADAIEAMRDDLYIAQYIQEMFTSASYDNFNHDQGNQGKSYDSTLSGYCKNPYNNYYAGAEIEYILYGNEDSMGANVVAAAATIFGIRFVLNLIYSFTDSEINSITTEIATALVGWTGFGVPILKTVLHIGLALGESAIDIAQLLDGQSVPIFKTSDTWVCKPSGVFNTVKKEALNTLINDAKKAAAKIVDEAANALSEKIDKLANEGKDIVSGTAEEVNNMTEEQIKLLKEAAKDEVFTPLNDLIVSCQDKQDSFVQDKVKEKLSDIREIVNKGGDGELKKIELGMLDYLEKESTVSKISGLILTAPNNFYSAEQDNLFYFENIYNETLEEIKGIIVEATNSVRDGINEAISEIAKELKNGVNKGKEKIKSSINSALDNINLGDAEDTEIGGSSIKSKLLSMNYNEYLYVFMLLNLIGNGETAILERTAKLININIAYAAEGADKTCSSLSEGKYLMSKLIPKKEGYNLYNAATVIKTGMTAEVQTSFLGAVVQQNGIDFTGLQDKKYRLVYNGVGGY